MGLGRIVTVQSESAQDEAQQYAEQAEELARTLYATSPALTAFSRVPIAYESARDAGINSWARAHAKAWKNVQEGSA